MKLTARDRAALQGVHPDLLRVVEAAAERTFLSWFVNEGVRTHARQKMLFDAGRTLTLDSLHLPRASMIDDAAQTVGHAVDLVLLNGKKAD